MFALYNAIHDSSADPGIGLQLGTESRPEHYNPIAIAALYSRSFGDALKRIARYKRLTSPQEIRIAERGREFAVEFVWLLAETTEAPTLIDVCFAWTVSIGRRGTGLGINPSRVELRRPEAHRRLYEDYFGCPVRFGARRNKLFFRAEGVGRPFVTHNPELLELVAPQLEAELKQQLAGRSLKEQAKGILMRLLAGQKPRLEDIAVELRVSARTPQRRLLEEGITFHDLVTAYLLGYEDPNSFIRAFHKWEGTSPGEWRQTRTLS